jgi:hypothetical protein
MKLILAVTTAAALSGHAALANEVFASKPKTVVTSLQELGYPATLVSEADGPRIDSTISGLNYSVFFYGCDGDGTACRSLEFNAGFTLDPPVKPNVIADWNRDNLFGTAYLDEQGVASISYSVTTVGGLTMENFTDVIARWDTTLASFASAIGY